MLSSVHLRGYAAVSDRIPENDAHISSAGAKNGASRNVDDVGNLTLHSSAKGSALSQIGPQRVAIEQDFGQYITSEVDYKHLNASHEVTADGRLKMGSLGQTKKRSRDEIEEDGDGSYWIQSQAKRHKSHREEFEAVSFICLCSLPSGDISEN